MAAKRQDIKRWFQQGAREGATHMIVVCDTFDWDDYPVYVKKGEDARTIKRQFDGKDMQKVMEVYNLTEPMPEQIDTKRSFNY